MEEKMSTQLTPTDKDVKTVLEAHDLLPEGPMLDEALKVVSLYSDRIQKVLSEFPETVDRHKALLAILEEGLMQEGFIPSKQGRKFEAPGRKKD
jgi:hypothetical protein